MGLVALLQTFSEYGYIGIFLTNLISSSTVIFPLPAFAFVFGAGAALDPILVGVFAGIGSTIGELTGYLIGIGSRELAERKHGRRLKKIHRLFERYGGDAIIFFFALTPLPFDIIGIFSGVIEHDLRRFILAVLAARILLNLGIAFAGFYGISWVLQWYGG